MFPIKVLQSDPSLHVGDRVTLLPGSYHGTNADRMLTPTMILEVPREFKVLSAYVFEITIRPWTRWDSFCQFFSRRR